MTSTNPSMNPPNEKVLERLRKIRALADDQAETPEGQSARARMRALMAEYGLNEDDLSSWTTTWDPMEGDPFSYRFDLLSLVAIHHGLPARIGKDGQGEVAGPTRITRQCIHDYRTLRRAIETGAVQHGPRLRAAGEVEEPNFWASWWCSALIGVLDRIDVLTPVEDPEEILPDKRLEGGESEVVTEERPTPSMEEAEPERERAGPSQDPAEDLAFLVDAYEIGYGHAFTELPPEFNPARALSMHKATT